MAEVKYHWVDSCNRCSGFNIVIAIDSLNGITSDAKTICEECGFRDHWSFGFFESSQEIKNDY